MSLLTVFQHQINTQILPKIMASKPSSDATARRLVAQRPLSSSQSSVLQLKGRVLNLNVLVPFVRDRFILIFLPVTEHSLLSTNTNGSR